MVSVEFEVQQKTVFEALEEKTRGLALAFFEDDLEKNALFKRLDAKLDGELKKALKDKEFEAKDGQALFLPTLGRLPARKLFAAGLGKEKEFDLDKARKFFGNAATAFKTSACPEFAVVLPESKKFSVFELSRALSESVLLADYEFDKYKTEKDEKEKKSALKKTIVFVKSNASKVREGIELGKIIAEATNTARSLANEPANVATPDYVARKFKELASRAKLKCVILDEKALKKQGFNALLGVAKGSAQPPRVVIIEYKGRGKDVVALVGKGITFDAGGISLKPAQDMDKMKFDKSGACAVTAVAIAAKKLRLPVNIVAVTPLTENVPSGSSYKPGDVLKGVSNKSIEVLNTDAEGRIILSDALSFTVKKFKPKILIDVATLTGACVIALGDAASGLLSNDDELAKDLIQAGMTSGDKVWQLPLWDEYAEKIKSDVGDVKNTGDGTAGAITAAMFLKNFVELEQAKKTRHSNTKSENSEEKKVKWAHLDIAGTAWVTKQKPCFSLGATGAGVRVILEYLLKKYGKTKNQAKN